MRRKVQRVRMVRTVRTVLVLEVLTGLEVLVLQVLKVLKVLKVLVLQVLKVPTVAWCCAGGVCHRLFVCRSINTDLCISFRRDEACRTVPFCKPQVRGARQEIGGSPIFHRTAAATAGTNGMSR